MTINQSSTPMRYALKLVILIAFALLGPSVGWLSAAPMSDAPVTAQPLPSASVSDSELEALLGQLSSFKQQVSQASNYSQLEGPQDLVQALIKEVDRLTTLLLPEQAQLQAQLGVLGPAPPDATPEKSDIALQRATLTGQKALVDAKLKSLATLKSSAAELLIQIAAIRRSLLESEVTQRTRSVLNPWFWATLFNPPEDDRQKFNAFLQQIGATLGATWRPGERLLTSFLIVMALVFWIFGRRVAERGLTWLCIHRMPEGRLRRSTLALSSVVATILSAWIALQLLFFTVTRELPLTPQLTGFSQDFEKIVYTCVLITGLSRALLSTQHPSWRLPAFADPLALAIKPYPTRLALALLVLVSLAQITNVTGMTPGLVISVRGLVALIVSAMIAMLLLRVNKTRRDMVAAGIAPEAGRTLAGMIYAFASIAIAISLLALLTGYISLSRFITYELVWFFIIFAGFYLLTQLFKDGCEHLFSPRHSTGKTLKQLLGIGDTRLEQISVILSGAGRAALLLIALITLMVGGIGSTLEQLATNILAMLGGDGLRKLNIVPANLLHAVLAVVIGLYLIRSLRRWLDDEFLPKTEMDPGMCASLSTLFSNIGYALVLLLTLSSLGVQWTNLAWIVSALSVGIGFGLQEIVKNFVSGIILLTERPVKVGDLISISGVEGDIRRINVRATEIQLADRSIVIVPNSQLISQNLRNVTLGGSAQGVATLELMFPLDIDPEQVRNLLYETFSEHETILEKPAPVVRFSQLKPEGITLTVTGYVNSPRMVTAIKSELLFEILKRLGAAGIELAKPPTA
ncbi:small-conductance mechanosensitive channel [Pseudomonas sp. G5(2012)]|jgi:potassium efflux system protein|nr:small-conductance mechanosensitive channel [Pseudomonas sp. G5(2012)]